MLDFSRIKLVIWDLDETFWKGTISEEPVEFVAENNELVKQLTDCGIVNSICSKNDFEVVKKQLQQADLWELFVFPSVNWQAKGARVKQLISDMNLRPANVLFIDDNSLNLKEVKYFCSEIMTLAAEEIPTLCDMAKQAEKKDLKHKRLKQYQVLQEKAQSREAFSDNEAFLRSCNICVQIKTDCMENADRLHELVLRSNQLNYTKLRPEKEEFIQQLKDSALECGYVFVSDNFGEYGIVGFYALQKNKLIHFVFSCRTLGMGIEQYVYASLNDPELTVVGEVASQLTKNTKPDWINQAVASDKQTAATVSGDILFKGPCDLMQIFSFIKNTENVHYEFTYNDENGKQMVGHNHTSSIITAFTASDARKAEIISEFNGMTPTFLNTSLTTHKYSFVCISLFLEANSTIYQRKTTGERIALCWDQIDRSGLEKNYDIVKNSDGSITLENLKKIRSLLPAETTLILLLPSELAYEEDADKMYLKNQQFNALVKNWTKEQENVKIVDFTEFIHSQSDYTGSVYHHSKRVYYEVAKALIPLLGQNSMQPKGKQYFFMRNLYSKIPVNIRNFFNKLILFKALYHQKHKEN